MIQRLMRREKMTMSCECFGAASVHRVLLFVTILCLKNESMDGSHTPDTSVFFTVQLYNICIPVIVTAFMVLFLHGIDTLRRYRVELASDICSGTTLYS